MGTSMSTMMGRSRDSSSDSDSDSDSDDDEVGGAAAAVVDDDGYEYEYYDEEDETPALAPVTPSGPTSILKKQETPSYSSGAYGGAGSSQQGASSSSYGGYGSSSYGASAYGGQTQEAPTRNSSAYGASSSSSYGASRAEAEQPAGRSQRSYSGARTTAYGGSWGQDSEPAATTTPLSPASSRRYSRYPSPDPSSSALSERRFSREDSSDSGAGYSSRYKRRDDTDSFVSRYLAKSRTSAGLAGEPQKSATPEDSVAATRKISGELQYPSGRSRYAALKERKAKLAKSKSSAMIGLGGNEDDDDDDGEEILTPFTSRFGGELARSRSSHMLKDQASPSGSRQPEASEQDENLSSWAKYLKNKYGGRGAATGNQPSSRESEKEERRARLGLSSKNEYDQSKKRDRLPR